jgi:hypothetical protein
VQHDLSFSGLSWQRLLSIPWSWFGPLLDFALKRQHRDIIFLWGSADVGKKICTNPFHEFQCV